MIWAIGIIFIAAAFFLAFRDKDQLSRTQWLALLAARLLAFVLLGLALFEVNIAGVLSSRPKPRLVLLVDGSQSMTLHDGGPESRWQRALALAGALEKQDGKFLFSSYAVARQGIEPLRTGDLSNPAPATDLSRGLNLALGP